MIGFLDTGIDYQNRVFRNLDGTTRIVGIWDQTIQTGRTPQGALLWNGIYGRNDQCKDLDRRIRFR